MFNQILDFIKVYWRECLSLCFLILSSILFALKKKPTWNKLETIYCAVLQKLPVFIDVVEKDGCGEEKLFLVLSLVKSYLIEEYKFNNFDEIEPLVRSWIESILSTPQKKED